MNEEIFSVPILFEDGNTFQGEFRATFLADNHSSKAWRLSLSFDDRLITRESSDLFEALIEIRRELEKGGIKLLCYGSCRDVCPSSMSRDMGGGLKAYRHTLGKRPGMKDMVHIFDTGDDVVPVSVHEQEDFRRKYEGWLKGLGAGA